MLKVEHLEKRYPNFRVENVTFRAGKGKITGIIGNNGAGKTTILKCILGVLRYHSGKITIDGKTVFEDEKGYKERIGVVFDNGYFYDNLSMKSMKDIIAGSYQNWDDEIYNGYMERFKLEQKQKIATLSKGMRMKYALALALSHSAEVLIFDEPTSGLDPKTRRLFCEEMLKQKEQGRTIIFSTHITSDLDKIGDDIVLINHGKVLRESSKEEFTGHASTIEEAMFETLRQEDAEE